VDIASGKAALGERGSPFPVTTLKVIPTTVHRTGDPGGPSGSDTHLIAGGDERQDRHRVSL